MYFPDLSPCIKYERGKQGLALNVGWLDPARGYVKGNVSGNFVKALWQFHQRPAVFTIGESVCKFCGQSASGQPAQPREQRPKLVGMEIHVWGGNGVMYVAPMLIYHYVVAHQYLPPAEFIQAVLAGRGLDNHS
jgi:hypothetical protein